MAFLSNREPPRQNWPRLKYSTLISTILFNIPLNLAFNLDIDIPIVKGGISNSYFGFSVAQHQIHTRQRENTEYVCLGIDVGVARIWSRGKKVRLWLTTEGKNNGMLVGAPLSSYFGDKAENPGAIYKCPLTSITDDCMRVKVEDDLPSDKDENRNNQWLGVTLKSHKNGDSVVTCGHRYSRSGWDYHWGFGICYSLTSALDYEEVYSPCVGRPVFKAHQQFGYCQAGTSAFLAPNDDLIIGAPGSYTWTGALFKTNIASGIFADRRWFFSPLEPPDTVPVPHYSYLGMSSFVGQFFGQAYSYVGGAPRSNGTGQIVMFTASNKTSSTNLEPKLILSGKELGSGYGYELIGMDLNADGYQDLVVGAPFHYDPRDGTVGGAVFVYMNGPKGIQSDEPLILTGRNESLFGYSLTSAGDLNQDGYDASNTYSIAVDLAVGAPNEGDGRGAVYIFHGSKNGLLSSDPPAQKISGSQLKIPTRASPFAYNNHPSPPVNSYQDDETLSFGHSLSGGIDMDGNGYPDLLIGAYRSDRIFLLRSRPIVNIFIDIRDLPNALELHNPTNYECPAKSDAAAAGLICFPIKVCLRFEAHPVSTFTSSIVVRYTINAERFNRKPFSRVNFFPHNPQQNPEPDKNHITTNVLRLAPQASNQFVCDQHTAYLKPETKDFLRPILFQLSVNLTSDVPQQFSDEPLVDINTYPILNQKMSNHVFQVKFLKDCGANDICESDIQLEASYKLPLSSNGASVLTLGQNKEISVQILLENFGEAAYETELYVHFPSTINYIGFKMPSTLSASASLYNDKSKSYLCSLWNATLIKCEIGNPFKPDEKVELTFNFDVTPLKLEDNNVTMFINVSTTSMDMNSYPKNTTMTALIIIKSEISLAGVSFPEQIFYGGIPRGESFMKKGSDIGSLIEHRYVVVNHGPGTIGASDVTIYWPYEVENNRTHGKWLLYLIRHPWVDGNGLCEIETSRVNFLELDVRASDILKLPNKTKSKSKKKLQASPDTILNRAKRKAAIAYKKIVRRLKRELVILPESKLLGGKVKNVVTMDCQKGSARCFTFNCHIGELSPSESIVIHLQARIWNSTLVEDYPTVDAVTILSRAKIVIDKKYHVEQNVSNDETHIETIAYPDLDVVMEHKENEPWIIIVAVCSGVFLFFLLTIGLWKMGFFKRKVIKPSHTARLEKHYNGISDL